MIPGSHSRLTSHAITLKAGIGGKGLRLISGRLAQELVRKWDTQHDGFPQQFGGWLTCSGGKSGLVQHCDHPLQPFKIAVAV